MKTTIDMAREAGCIPVRHPEYDNDVQVFATPDVLKAFEALVRADEREKYEAIIASMTKLLEAQQKRESVAVDMLAAGIAAERARGQA
jgi:hypothetical protein